MGFAAATAKDYGASTTKMSHSDKIVNEVVIGHDLSQQFEIFPEMVKMIAGVNIAMVNILDGKNQFTIGDRDFRLTPL